jgi:outer membrane receptor for ferrienterochelin and colicins
MRALLPIALTVLAPASLAAQAAVLMGSVRDAATRAPLAGATLVLRGTPLSTVADRDGRFTFPALPAGRYVVIAAAIGYAVDSLVPRTLAAGERVEVTLLLDAAPIVLDEMVVTAGRTAERTEEAIASVAVLSSRDLIDRNVATVDKALAYVPGVTFNGDELLDIRGAAGFARGIGSRVLLMLDGHPILTGDGAELDFRSIPLLDLDRAEVVKGAYSAVYGSNALGGVVNLVTSPVGLAPETVVRIHGDAYDFQPEYAWSGELQSAFGFGAQHSRRIGSIGARAFMGYEVSDGYSENGEYRRWLGRLKLGSAPGSVRPWDAYAVFSSERAGEAFLWRSADDPYRVPESAAGNYTVGYKLFTGASVVPYARPTLLVRLTPFVNVNSLENFFQDNDDWHSAVKPGLTAELALYGNDRHAARVGVDGAYTWVSSNYIGSPRITDLAAFAQDEVRLGGALKGSLGLRLDYHVTDLTASEWRLSPKLGAALQLAPNATLRASVGAGYRAPSAIEQFVSSRQFGFRVVPNLDLTGEYAWSGELGTSLTLARRLRLDAGAFGSLYSDLISPGPAPDEPFVYQFQNVARARVAGVDLGLSAELVPRAVDVQATYLLLDTEDRDTGEPLPYRSRHNVTGTVTLLDGLAGVDVRYRTRIEEVLAFPLDERGDVTVVDLRVGYRLWSVLWQARVANLFNRFYVDVQERNPGAPRSFTLTAVYGL